MRSPWGHSGGDHHGVTTGSSWGYGVTVRGVTMGSEGHHWVTMGSPQGYGVTMGPRQGHMTTTGSHVTTTMGHMMTTGVM